jgi:hypothetical protein
MQGMEKTTVQDYVNQAREKADGPGFNGPAPGAQAVRAPQDYEVVERKIGAWFFDEIDVDGYTAKVGVADLSALYFAGEPRDVSEFEELIKAMLKYYHLEPVEILILDPDAGCNYPHVLVCANNNLICYLARALYKDYEDVETMSFCEGSFARDISFPPTYAPEHDRFKIQFAYYDIHESEEIAAAAARYAIEQLHIEEPIIMLITEGYMNAIVIAKRGDEA